MPLQDREKYMLTRTLVDELASVMKLKSSLPDSTLMILVHFILQVGSNLGIFCLFVFFVFLFFLKSNVDFPV